MASRKPKEPQVEQVIAPDFDLAVKLYRQDIKPAQGRVGEFSQEMSTAYKAIKKQAHIQPQAAKAAFKLDDMEESKRDDYLRSFNGLLKKLNIFMPTDLVDAAEGNGSAGEEVIPTGQRARPQLATIQGGKRHPSDDGDLAGGVAEESGVDKAKRAANAAEEDSFGIVNERTGEWLAPQDDDGDGGWVKFVGDAGKWTHGDATGIVGEFEVSDGDTLVVRRIVG